MPDKSYVEIDELDIVFDMSDMNPAIIGRIFQFFMRDMINEYGGPDAFLGRAPSEQRDYLQHLDQISEDKKDSDPEFSMAAWLFAGFVNALIEQDKKLARAILTKIDKKGAEANRLSINQIMAGL